MMIMELSEETYNKKDLYLCSMHFENSCFDSKSEKIRRLKLGAVPHLTRKRMHYENVELHSQKKILTVDSIDTDSLFAASTSSQVPCTITQSTSRKSGQTTNLASRISEMCDKSTLVSPQRICNSPIKVQLRNIIKKERKSHSLELRRVKRDLNKKKKRIRSLKSLLTVLKKKFLITEEQQDALNTEGILYEHLLNIKKGKKKIFLRCEEICHDTAILFSESVFLCTGKVF
ncbi:hypothetical protein ABEB36_006126 [Hypothenemus hampei]|uniref:THAP-type domain-containing protein n=1 Tax=Hypothenemus hampei TaxID=57062 RepID=A0ABD1F0K6_HYPHA